MKTDYEYIEFFPSVRSPKETMVWYCHSRRHKTRLGTVLWYGSWRQYCFVPYANTVFSAGCLADIRDFIGQVMEDRG